MCYVLAARSDVQHAGMAVSTAYEAEISWARLVPKFNQVTAADLSPKNKTNGKVSHNMIKWAL